MKNKFYIVVQLMERTDNKSPETLAAKMVWRGVDLMGTEAQYKALLGLCKQEGFDLDLCEEGVSEP